MSRTTTPVVLRNVARTRLATRGTRYGHVTASGTGGVGPPGVGLGKAGDPGSALGVRAGGVGEVAAWPVPPGRPLQAHSARTIDARTAALMYALTVTSNTGYGGLTR